jgi:hypothetical protein
MLCDSTTRNESVVNFCTTRNESVVNFCRSRKQTAVEMEWLVTKEEKCPELPSLKKGIQVILEDIFSPLRRPIQVQSIFE